MLRKSDGNDRRILNFPAVHPCEGISPATLLSSLAELSRTTCGYRSKFFATQRRNARETIRQTGILLALFEEVRERRSALPESAVLCLSELHVTFQKIQFLLEDCAREGARIWILTKCHSIASQFMSLIRMVATALDVLPLNSLDLSDEVREMVELLATQARRASFQLDREDKTAMNRVRFVLSRLEAGESPDLEAIRKVLEHLDIQSWRECNKEIKFLEHEIIYRQSSPDEGERERERERELPLLSGLAACMSYCRGAVFETFDYRNVDDDNRIETDFETLDCLSLEDFRCPISLEIMSDPVTVSTGHTYDRSSIQRWLKSGNPTCPKTGDILTSTELVPNSNMRRLIQSYCAERGIISISKSKKKNRNIASTAAAGSAAAAEAIKSLAEFLAARLVSGTSFQKNKAAYEIRLLAKSNIFNRSCLIEAQTVPPLLSLLASPDPSAQENAISALLKLSKHPNGKREITKTGGLRPILNTLKRGKRPESRRAAAAVLFYLAAVEENRLRIGESQAAIQGLVDLIRDAAPSGKKNAVVALYALLLSPENHRRVVDAGAVPFLVSLAAEPSSERGDPATDALAALASLAEGPDGGASIVATPAALPLVRAVLACRSGRSRAEREYAASILLSMCVCEGGRGGGGAVAAAAGDGSIMGSLYAIVADDAPHASSRARALIKLLQRFHEGDEEAASGWAGGSRDRFVHVR